jgi:hypothetical protein
MVFIFNEAGAVIGGAFGQVGFTSHDKALAWISNNTSNLENGDKFIIVDFENDYSEFYIAQLKMTIEPI